MASVTCSRAVEAANPRHRGWCVRCGKSVDEHNRIPLERDREFEDLTTRELATGLADPEPLIAYARKRADRAQAEYGHDFPDTTRDLEVEALDELADCRNYIVWRLDGIRRGLFPNDHWRVPHLQMALRGVITVFEQLQQARG